MAIESLCPFLTMRKNLLLSTCPRKRDGGCEMWDEERECCGLRNVFSREEAEYFRVETIRTKEREELARR